MKEPADQMSGARRTFLKAAVAAGGVTALTNVGASPSPRIVDPAAPPTSAPEEGPTGYHETAHIRDYYQTLRE